MRMLNPASCVSALDSQAGDNPALTGLGALYSWRLVLKNTQGQAKVGLQLRVWETRSLFLRYYLMIIVLFICIM